MSSGKNRKREALHWASLISSAVVQEPKEGRVGVFGFFFWDGSNHISGI